MRYEYVITVFVPKLDPYVEKGKFIQGRTVENSNEYLEQFCLELGRIRKELCSSSQGGNDEKQLEFTEVFLLFLLFKAYARRDNIAEGSNLFVHGVQWRATDL